MQLNLSEIARLIGADYAPPPDPPIIGVASLEEAKEGDITFLMGKKDLQRAMETKASAMIVPLSFEEASFKKASFEKASLDETGSSEAGFDEANAGNLGIPHLRSENPFYSFTMVMSLFSPPPEESLQRGVDERSIIGKNATIGKDVYVGAYSIIGDRAKIGDRTVIYPQVFLGDESIVGDDCIIYPQVSIYSKVEIGCKVIVHSGAVIGSDGFGYLEKDGKRHKIPQIGRVVIEDEVEIGANTTIDRATLGKTKIEKGTKIDNLVQIGHNTVIGSDTVIAGMVGISGSVVVGPNVTLAGQVGVSDHVEIGEGVIAGGQSGISKSVPPKTVVFGSPAGPFREEKRRIASLRMLPELFKTVDELKKRVKELEDKFGVSGG